MVLNAIHILSFIFDCEIYEIFLFKLILHVLFKMLQLKANNIKTSKSNLFHLYIFLTWEKWRCKTVSDRKKYFSKTWNKI
jgi:hypothetical protein